MYELNGKRVVLGVTGGIAAYKVPILIRGLLSVGAEVRVVMTRAAEAFVSPLTLQTLSGRAVHRDLLDPEQEGTMSHIELARWADLILVAPATANFIARLALGLADDLLSTLCLATTARLAVAPAMNRQMWLHPATQANVETLRRRGVSILGPDSGAQACGETGPGRMLEPDVLLARVGSLWEGGPLQGVGVLVTAGPTREPIDPVRFVGNRSSGKMGYAVAEALRDLGAQVCLVSGPVSLDCPPGIERVQVETAVEMHDSVVARLTACSLFVGTAAVADYRVAEVAPQKIKKTGEGLHIRLTPNPDILAEVAQSRQRPFCVGFAAETQDLEAHARGKLQDKGLDMIAANLVAGEHGGFERDENELYVYWPGGAEHLPQASKPLLARRLATLIAERYHSTNRAEDS